MKKILVLSLILSVFLFTGCELLTALFGKVTVTFELNGGHINGSKKDVVITGDPGEEFELPQNPFMNADESYRYEFNGWQAASSTYTFDHESYIYDTKQVATFPEGNITYIAKYDKIHN